MHRICWMPECVEKQKCVFLVESSCRPSSKRKKPLQVWFPCALELPSSSEHAFCLSKSSLPLPPFPPSPSWLFMDFLGTPWSFEDRQILSLLTAIIRCLWTAQNPAGWPHRDTRAGPGPPARSRLWSLLLSEGRMLEFSQENRCALWANLTTEKHFPVPFKGAQLPG